MDLPVFYPCSKTLSEAGFKSNGQINLVEEISRQCRGQALACLFSALARFIVKIASKEHSRKT